MSTFKFENLRNNIYFWKQKLAWNVVFQASIYLFKVNNRNTRKMQEICSNFTMRTPERRRWCRSGVVLVNFEQNSHITLLFHCFHCWIWTSKYPLGLKRHSVISVNTSCFSENQLHKLFLMTRIKNNDSLLCPLFIVGFLWQDFYFEQV